MISLSEIRFLEIINNINKIKPIIVLGDVGIDKYTFGEVKRISPEAPVPVVEVSKEWLKLGLAANVAHNLKTIGVNSTLCSVIGSDVRADVFERLLEEINLSIWGLVRDETRQTTYKERVTTNTQQICRVDYETSRPICEATEIRLKKRLEDFSKNHSALIIEDYSKGTLTDKLIVGSIAEAKKNKIFVAVDPGKDTDPRLYTGADLIKPNLNEAKVIAEKIVGKKIEKIEDLAKTIQENLKTSSVVITLGAEGMAILDDKGYRVIPTVATEVFDVSGAGDTSISLLVSSLLAGASLDEAAWIANCAAAVVVGKKGTATVTLSELINFFQKNK